MMMRRQKFLKAKSIDFIPQFSPSNRQRTSPKSLTLQSKSLQKAKQTKDAQKSQKIICDFLKESLVKNYRRVSQNRKIFILPTKMENKNKNPSSKQSQLSCKEKRYGTEHDQDQGEDRGEGRGEDQDQDQKEFPLIYRKQNLLNQKNKEMKRNKFISQRITKKTSSSSQTNLPDNSKLNGLKAERRSNFHFRSEVQSPVNESSVNIVFECDQEEENNQTITEEQSEQSYKLESNLLVQNNPMTIQTLYGRYQSKKFENRFYPNKTMQKNVFEIPQFPHAQKIHQFILEYSTKTELIKKRKFVTSPFFQIIVNNTPKQQELFFGEIRANLRSGLGVYLTRKELFQGIWFDDEPVRGIVVKEQYQYEGEIKDRMRHGNGKCTWSNGDVYVGEWENDLMHGHGYWHDSLASISYLGYWSGNKPDGLGVFKKKGISVYEGETSGWKPEGKGKQTFENGDLFQGNFRKGLPEGKGEYIWKNRYKYSGLFKEGVRTGSGAFSVPGILFFSGEYLNDLPNGEGRIKYINDDQYKGNLNNGLRHGLGTLTCKNRKKIFSGHWIDDTLHVPTDF